MKLKYFYILLIFFSGCNEFIDLTGKFINRLNETKNINTIIKISVKNIHKESLSNILISMIDEKDSVFLTSSKLTDNYSYVLFNLPDEQIKNISLESNNIIIIAEHPALGISGITVPINNLYENTENFREFVFDVNPTTIERKNISEFNLYNQILSRSSK